MSAPRGKTGGSMDPAALERTLRDLALAAGAEIMAQRAAGFSVERKSDRSPVTEADRAADALISAGLARAFPDIPCVTEEAAETHATRAERFFIVDPLDGTREFVRGDGDFTVNIALIDRGVPRAGVIFAPVRRRLFYTTAAGGAVEEGPAPDGGWPGPRRGLHVARPDPAGLRVVASRSHLDPQTEAFIARFDVAGVTSAGSSLKFCLVAAGEADLYPRFGPTMEWDIAAGDAILRAAGGTLIDLRTRAPMAYGKPGWLNGPFAALAPGVPDWD
jgi:3'(2'), 5'-bisphosphate nucleotidase